jgi:hypothetical protein
MLLTAADVSFGASLQTLVEINSLPKLHGIRESLGKDPMQRHEFNDVHMRLIQESLDSHMLRGAWHGERVFDGPELQSVPDGEARK